MCLHGAGSFGRGFAGVAVCEGVARIAYLRPKTSKMKHLIIFFALLLSQQVYGFMIYSLDTYMNKGIQGVEYNHYNKKGELVETSISDSKGLAYIVEKFKKGDYVTFTYNKQNYQADYNRISYEGDHYIYFYPTQTYIEAVKAMEDSIYGKVAEPKNTFEQDSDGEDVSFEKIEIKEDLDQSESAKMQRFIAMNLQYPQKAIENGDSGKVMVSFILEKDGVVTHVNIEEGVSKELNREAIRIVRAIPKWKPGMKEGEPVRTRCRMPIIFELTYN